MLRPESNQFQPKLHVILEKKNSRVCNNYNVGIQIIIEWKGKVKHDVLCKKDLVYIIKHCKK